MTLMTSRSTVAAVVAGFLTGVALYVANRRRSAEKRKEMSCRLKDVTVQILFSCDPPSAETFQLAYPCALLPFVLGIPSNQVVLLMAPAFIGNFRAGIRAARLSYNTMGNTTLNVLPHGYYQYFHEIYQLAVDATSLGDFGPPSIRIVSGRAFGDRNGGYLKFQGRKVSFSQMAPAAMLTVLDVSSSAFAVASMTGEMPADPQQFRSKHRKVMFARNRFPIVCDNANSMFAFRLGYEGQHHTQGLVTSMNYDERNFAGMSSEFMGGKVSACLMHAIRSFVTGTGKAATLDELFQDQYGRLRRDFLLQNPADDPPLPYSNLGQLQTMLEEGVFPVRMDAFGCTLLDRNEEWFLMEERVQFDITSEDEDFMETIIDYIVSEVSSWYKESPDGMCKEGTIDKNLADREWDTILTYLGQFAYRLRSIQLDIQNGQLVKSSDGVPIGVWASPYGKKLSACRREIEKMLSRYKDLLGDESSIESNGTDEE